MTETGKPTALSLSVVFLCAFIAYQLPLPLLTTTRYPDFWFFGSDNYRISLEQPGTHPAANYQISKHPAFVAVAIPLHRFAKALVTPLPEPLRENAALTFPSAIFGAANACLALLLFSLIGFRGVPLFLVTVMYAASAAVWMFASFPDTYACTTLVTTAYLWFYLRDPELKRWKPLAAWNAFAILVAPQQILLATLPGVGTLARAHRDYITRLLGYAAVIGSCVIFYWLWLALLGRGGIVARETRWATLENLTDWHTYATIGLTYLSLAIVVPSADQMKPSVTLQDITPDLGVWIVLIGVVAYGLVGRLRPRLHTAGNSGLCCRLELAAFVGAYALFFTWWQPKEAFLYSAPVQLPLWLLLHDGWVDRQDSRLWRTGMTAATAILIAGSLLLLWRLRTPPQLFFK